MQLDRNKLDMIRATQYISITELAEKSGLSKYTIYGACKRSADVVTVGKIAKALRVPVRDIIIQEE